MSSGELFAQVDTNRDGVIDRDEFANLVGASDSTSGGSHVRSKKVGGKYGSSSFESSRYSSGVGVEDVGVSGSYQSSSYQSTNAFDASAFEQAANYTADSNAAWSRYGAEVRGVGLYFDANPEIIRRQLPGGSQTYTQHIRIRFFQPPPVPASGPLIVKEVRPPPLPALPPLRIRQQQPPLPQLPPLILRERPPQPPAIMASETVVRNLPALPPPPRSVIIERYPAAPAPPRDIIIERWLPYSASAERKTIVQRAEAAIEYPPPRNVIIEYESTDARVVRQFQQLGITRENPQTYLAQYGTQVLDTETLLRQAHAAGVIEDLSVPSGFTSLSYSSDVSLGVSGEVGLTGEDLGGVSSSYSSGGYRSTSANRDGGLVSTEFEDGYVGRGGNGFRSSRYESSSYSSGGGIGSDTASRGFSSTYAKL